MDLSVMERFLTKENIREHLSYLNGMRLKYSIIEKSIHGIKDKTPREIYKMNLSKELKNEILPLINGIICHKIYFSSFVDRPLPCKEIKRFFTSEQSFLYELSEIGKTVEYGFLLIGIDRRGRPYISCYNDFCGSIPEGAVLALDLSEHAYFLDYHYEKGKYLNSALNFLDMGKLFLENKRENYLDSLV